ncbi:hypothetical protein BDAP_001579 [Binucleata daphniae]
MQKTGQNIVGLLDSGSPISIISSQYAKEYRSQQSEIQLYNGSGNKMKMLGTINDVKFCINNDLFTDSFILRQDLTCDVILGRDFFKKNIAKISNNNNEILIQTYNTNISPVKMDEQEFNIQLEKLLHE